MDPSRLRLGARTRLPSWRAELLRPREPLDHRRETSQEGVLMGRNARKRAARHEAEHPHGVKPAEEGEGVRRPPTHCPRCGSANIVITPSRSWMPGGGW